MYCYPVLLPRQVYEAVFFFTSDARRSLSLFERDIAKALLYRNASVLDMAIFGIDSIKVDYGPTRLLHGLWKTGGWLPQRATRDLVVIAARPHISRRQSSHRRRERNAVAASGRVLLFYHLFGQRRDGDRCHERFP
jgi:hypothetical protein